MENNRQFHGAKLFLFVGEQIATILRDEISGIPHPGHWDFPGGGREGDESAEACVLRELQEELGLVLSARDLIWSRQYDNPSGPSVFFAAHIPLNRAAELRLGDEGQCWRLMLPGEYVAHPRAIAKFADRLQDYMQMLAPPGGVIPTRRR